MACRTGKSASLALLVAVAACGSPFDVTRDEAPFLQTAESEFQVIRHELGGMEVVIPYSYTNRTGSKVLLANCNGGVSPSLERKWEGKWVTAWTPVVLLCLSPPIEIQRGETYRDTLHVVAAAFGSKGRPQFAFEDIEGTYRLRWDPAYWERNSEPRELPLKFRVSNEFKLNDS